jgi:hypothetical protein
MTDNRRISVDDAVECVRFMICGEDLIGPPTNREMWLIKKYIEGDPNIWGKTIYLVGGRPWVEYPSDRDLVAKVEQARDRADWRKEQYKQAEDWLEDHRFDLSDENFPIDELAREVKREFPDAYSRLARAGGLLASDRPLDEQKALDPAPDPSPALPLPAVEQEAAIPAPDPSPATNRGGRPASVKKPVTQVWNRRREEGSSFVNVSAEYRAIGNELNLPDKSAKNAKAIISNLARALKP